MLPAWILSIGEHYDNILAKDKAVVLVFPLICFLFFFPVISWVEISGR